MERSERQITAAHARPALGSIRGRREVTLQGEPVLVTGGTGCRCSRIIDLLRKEESAETVAVDNMVRQSKNLAASLGPSAVRALDALSRKRVNL